jgi:2-methylisocitrate lyase-like PEP mutase family enzyme
VRKTCVQGPCCHDALSVKLIENANFQFAFMSGFCTSAAALGLPDTGLISYAEMVSVGRSLHEATKSIPIIGDGDTGYGNAMNVKRTVKGYASAGFAGAACAMPPQRARNTSRLRCGTQAFS